VRIRGGKRALLVPIIRPDWPDTSVWKSKEDDIFSGDSQLLNRFQRLGLPQFAHFNEVVWKWIGFLIDDGRRQLLPIAVRHNHDLDLQTSLQCDLDQAARSKSFVIRVGRNDKYALDVIERQQRQIIEFYDVPFGGVFIETALKNEYQDQAQQYKRHVLIRNEAEVGFPYGHTIALVEFDLIVRQAVSYLTDQVSFVSSVFFLMFTGEIVAKNNACTICAYMRTLVQTPCKKPR
jgi:hypothetical protein